MRSYVAKVTTIRDRPRAFSFFGLASVVAVTAGPLFQLLFSPLKYPGINILFDKIRLNIYTGPIYVAVTANILSLVLILFVFHDNKTLVRENDDKKLFNKVNLRAIAKALSANCKRFDVTLVILCIVHRMVVTVGMVTMHTTTSPLLMSVVGLSNTQTVTYNSVSQAFVGSISLAILLSFSTKRFGKMFVLYNEFITEKYSKVCINQFAFTIFTDSPSSINERLGALLPLFIFLIMYAATYPWPFNTSHVVIKNATDPTSVGCDENMYKWCADSPSINAFVYLGTMVLSLGFGITLSLISVDSLYSKILGNIDQGPMQGIFLFCADVINICGPLIIAPAFTATGQKYIWMANGIIVSGMTVLWCAFYGRLKPYVNRPAGR